MMLMPRHDQIMMHLVADKDDVMAQAQISDGAQLIHVPDAATGIMRRAQEEQPLITAERGLQRAQIHLEPVILDDQR